MNNVPMTADEAMYLLWVNTTQKANAAMHADEWHWQVYYLSQYGRGMEEALTVLYNHRPDYSGFQQWLLQIEPLRDATSDLGDVLSDEDIVRWHQDGYIVIKNAVPEQQCLAARLAIWEFLNADIENKDSWYAPHTGKKGMMLNFFQHPALNAVRTSAKIRKVYEQLYGSEDIYLLIDKVSFNPPENMLYKFAGSPLHWDVSIQPPVPYVLQGFIYLNDVAADEGAFHCVPGFHDKLEQWLNSLPMGVDARNEAARTLMPVAVPGNAGDLVIWHQALPHCATPNTGSTPRLVQYVAYKPVQPVLQQQWK